MPPLNKQISCPKCNSELVYRYPPMSSRSIRSWCPNCDNFVQENQCVSCNETYYYVGEMANHKCSEKHEREKKAGEKLAEQWEEGDLSYKRSEERRLYEYIYPLPERKDDTPPCDNCKTWGRTITREDNPNAIPCGICGRLTWPNLGVNLPAGAAVSLSCSNALWIQRQLQKLGKLQEPNTLYSEIREKLLGDDKNV